MTGGDYEFVDSRLGQIPTDRDRARVARTRNAARRTVIARLPRHDTRTVLAALDLWPRDERDAAL